LHQQQPLPQLNLSFQSSASHHNHLSFALTQLHAADETPILDVQYLFYKFMVGEKCGDFQLFHTVEFLVHETFLSNNQMARQSSPMLFE
jgi:hypothetical protein